MEAELTIIQSQADFLDHNDTYNLNYSIFFPLKAHFYRYLH